MPADFPVIVAGNKCDLEGNREVNTEEGRAWAQTRGFPFIETSAKTRKGIDEVFRGAYALLNAFS